MRKPPRDVTRKPFWGDVCLPQTYEGGVTLNEIWDAMKAASDIDAFIEAHEIAKRYGLAWMCPICVERTVHRDARHVPVTPKIINTPAGQRITCDLRVCLRCYISWWAAAFKWSLAI